MAKVGPIFDITTPQSGAKLGYHSQAVSDIIKSAFDIGVQDPFTSSISPCNTLNFLDCIMAPPTWAKPVTDPLKSRFPERFEGVFHHGLNASINDGGYA